MFRKIFTPFKSIDKQTALFLGIVQLCFLIIVWNFSADGLYPTPLKVLINFFAFLSDGEFYNNLFISLLLTLKAMFISIIIALFLGYSYSLPVFRPVVEFISKCRYLTLTGILFIFMLVLKDGGSIKLSVLIFGIVPFFVTSFLGVFNEITKEEINQGKTLRLTPWENLYEVVILGKLDLSLEIMRQNFAIAWMMITTVESMSMSGGGIGLSLFKYNKYNDINNIFALQLVIFVVGLISDMLLNIARKYFFPYTQIQKN